MTGKEKIKLFVSNMVVYGAGNVITKIIPFIMLPIITRMMPSTSYFGISDMASTIISFASGIATMGVYDAMFRLYFDKEDERHKKSICSTALFFVICNSLCIMLIMFFLSEYLTKLFFSDIRYKILIYICGLSTFVSTQGSIEAAPTRMHNKRRIFMITNFLSSLLAYSFSIILLYKGKYVIAIVCGTLLSGAMLDIVFILLNHSFFSIKYVDMVLLKDLLKIGIPVMPSIIVYWIFHSSDRLMITNILGLGSLGIYSAAAKLGQASQIIYTAFAGGWQYYAFYTMKEEQQVESNSHIFEYLGVLSLTASLYVFSLIKPIFKLLLTEDYSSGSIAAPFLFLGPLLLMLYQVVGNQFMIAKRTLPSLVILSLGAMVNVVMNYILIPAYEIEGAAIATLLGYLFSLIVMCIYAWKNNIFIIKNRLVFSLALFIVYAISWRIFYYSNTLISTIIAVTITVVYIYLYREDWEGIFKNIKKK